MYIRTYFLHQVTHTRTHARMHTRTRAHTHTHRIEGGRVRVMQAEESGLESSACCSISNV